MNAGAATRLRAALGRARLTLFLLALLFVTYAFELLVYSTFGFPAYVWTFLARLSPSPGWVLAPFAHSLARPGHLLGVAGVLAVMGTAAERRLSPGAYLGLFVGAAYASVFAQVATYLAAPPVGTFGASGAVMALAAFVAVDVAMAAVDGTPVTPADGAVAVSGLVFVVARVVLDLGVVVAPAAGTAPVGHATGATVGVVYAVWRAA